MQRERQTETEREFKLRERAWKDFRIRERGHKAAFRERERRGGGGGGGNRRIRERGHTAACTEIENLNSKREGMGKHWNKREKSQSDMQREKT